MALPGNLTPPRGSRADMESAPTEVCDTAEGAVSRLGTGPSLIVGAGFIPPAGVCARRTVLSKFCFLTPSAFERAVLFCPGLRGGRAAYRGAGRAGDNVRALSQNRTLCRARRKFTRLSGRCPVTPPPRGATMAASRERRVFHNAAGIPLYQ